MMRNYLIIKMMNISIRVKEAQRKNNNLQINKIPQKLTIKSSSRRKINLIIKRRLILKILLKKIILKKRKRPLRLKKSRIPNSRNHKMLMKMMMIMIRRIIRNRREKKKSLKRRKNRKQVSSVIYANQNLKQEINYSII